MEKNAVQTRVDLNASNLCLRHSGGDNYESFNTTGLFSQLIRQNQHKLCEVQRALGMIAMIAERGLGLCVASEFKDQSLFFRDQIERVGKLVRFYSRHLESREISLFQ